MGADFISKMKHRLDRLKSEFAYARHAYFTALNEDSQLPNILDENIEFEKPFESERLGMKSEALRVAFRSCFSILDKIAFGLCELLNLPVKEDESVNFHQSLWKPSSPRWEALKSYDRNHFLAALYSQATDLSEFTDGEWSAYRKWRNALEHGYLVLQKSPDASDPHDVLSSEMAIEVIPLPLFQRKALHLLQFTRSAIFNFVYCSRLEGWKVQQDIR